MFQIVKPGPPEEPKNLEVTAVDDTSINLQWTPGFDGGYNQSFDIQVFDESSGLRILKLKNIRRVEGNKTNILGLTPQTRYLMKIRSWNREGYSNFSDEITITTRCKYLYQIPFFFFKFGHNCPFVTFDANQIILQNVRKECKCRYIGFLK